MNRETHTLAHGAASALVAWMNDVQQRYNDGQLVSREEGMAYHVARRALDLMTAAYPRCIRTNVPAAWLPTDGAGMPLPPEK